MKINCYKYMMLLAALLVFSSCEDMLTLKPEDSFNPSDYFKSEAELERWTNAFYYLLPEADALAGQNGDNTVDNALGDLMNGQRDPASEGGWSWSYLRRINYFLQHSSNGVDQNIRNHYDGVAYFFRALFYSDKVKRYGDVPWYNQVLEADDDALLFKAREDRGIIMDSINADLDRAIALLPAEHSLSRVTKWTALALKTRANLYEGTFRKYHGLDNSDKYLQQSAEAGASFISNSGYTIYNKGATPYRDLFNRDDDNTVADEVILARIYSSDINYMNGIQFNISNMKQGFTRRFVNHYLMADGSRFDEKPGWETMQYPAEVRNRDPRLAQTILAPGYVQSGETSETKNQLLSYTGYQPIKFVGPKAYDGASKSVVDWALFRSAEVYLNFAEAKAELGTLTQSDLDQSINKIRDRVHMPHLLLEQANQLPDALLLKYYPNVTKGENTGVILEIRRERTIELAMEGFRQWDLLRWAEGKAFEGPFLGMYFPGPGKYDMNDDGTDDLALWQGTEVSIPGGTSKEIGKDVILSEGDHGYIVAYPNFKLAWDETRDYLWPIPTDQRVLTKGKLSQNPGYQDSSGY